MLNSSIYLYLYISNLSYKHLFWQVSIWLSDVVCLSWGLLYDDWNAGSTHSVKLPKWIKPSHGNPSSLFVHIFWSIIYDYISCRNYVLYKQSIIVPCLWHDLGHCFLVLIDSLTSLPCGSDIDPFEYEVGWIYNGICAFCMDGCNILEGIQKAT